MYLPDRIEILGVPYRILLVDVVDKSELSFGQIDYFECVIRIDKTLPADMQKITLVHEVLHGICTLLGIDIVNEDERIIQNLAGGLYSTFKNTDIFNEKGGKIEE